MKYRVSQTAQFRKDYKRILKRNYDISLAHLRPVPMSENLLFLIRENFVEFF